MQFFVWYSRNFFPRWVVNFCPFLWFGGGLFGVLVGVGGVFWVWVWGFGGFGFFLLGPQDVDWEVFLPPCCPSFLGLRIFPCQRLPRKILTPLPCLLFLTALLDTPVLSIFRPSFFSFSIFVAFRFLQFEGFWFKLCGVVSWCQGG